jgi:membrane fusion protein (multidrug efflux system)
MRRTHPTRALLVLGAAALLGGCQAGTDPGPSPGVQAEAPDPVLEVSIDRVRRGSIVQRIAAPASLVARRESHIGPEVGGRIERIYVSEGDRVEAGAPLFEIDREPYSLALRQIQARRERTRAELRQLRSDLARARLLRRQDVLSQQEIDRIETSLAVARAAVAEADEAVAMAQRNLDRTVVRAPYAGSIAARLADEGTTALTQPQTIVVVIQEVSELEAQATIPEVHFDAIGVGDPALLTVEGLPAPIQTEVSAVADSIDPATRTYLVKMRVPNQERQLKAGVFARVEILPSAKSRVLLVPRSAVRREDGRSYVLGVRDERAVIVPIQLGVVAEDVVEVLQGLRADDEIIVGEQAATLGPGMRVRRHPDPDPPT